MSFKTVAGPLQIKEQGFLAQQPQIFTDCLEISEKLKQKSERNSSWCCSNFCPHSLQNLDGFNRTRPFSAYFSPATQPQSCAVTPSAGHRWVLLGGPFCPGDEGWKQELPLYCSSKMPKVSSLKHPFSYSWPSLVTSLKLPRYSKGIS